MATIFMQIYKLDRRINHLPLSVCHPSTRPDSFFKYYLKVKCMFNEFLSEWMDIMRIFYAHTSLKHLNFI